MHSILSVGSSSSYGSYPAKQSLNLCLCVRVVFAENGAVVDCIHLAFLDNNCVNNLLGGHDVRRVEVRSNSKRRLFQERG